MTTRLVALGASNLTRFVLALLDAARARAAGPIEAHAALGRGRSYGIPSRILWRGLPGIDDCGLWPALAACAPAPTTALLMDVGNDLLYGVEVPRILGWVERAVSRLQRHADRLVVVGLPMDSLRQLPPWRFTLVRSVLVPRCRLTLPDTLALAEQLQAGLQRLANDHGAAFQTLPGAWYGFDPVHFQRRHWRTAAQLLLSAPAEAAASSPLDTHLGRLGCLFAAPAERTLFGSPRRHPQPARRWPDGTTLSLW